MNKEIRMKDKFMNIRYETQKVELITNLCLPKWDRVIVNKKKNEGFTANAWKIREWDGNLEKWGYLSFCYTQVGLKSLSLFQSKLYIIKYQSTL